MNRFVEIKDRWARDDTDLDFCLDYIDELRQAANSLLGFVREKYDVKDNDFECPHMKNLAEACDKGKVDSSAFDT